jgi:hypothetical protein
MNRSVLLSGTEPTVNVPVRVLHKVARDVVPFRCRHSVQIAVGFVFLS